MGGTITHVGLVVFTECVHAHGAGEGTARGGGLGTPQGTAAGKDRPQGEGRGGSEHSGVHCELIGVGIERKGIKSINYWPGRLGSGANALGQA